MNNKLKLVIISHTEHYMSNGTVVGWGATVRELNYIAPYFEHITHVAPLHNEVAPASSLSYEADNITFVPLKATGGESIIDKLGVVAAMLPNLRMIAREVKKADLYQFRAPTGMGIYTIPYLLKLKKSGWFKYAGNWEQDNPPLSYALQKKMLVKQKHRKVTINGTWPGQPAHCLSFENPCLTGEERVEGGSVICEKQFDGKLNFCFVGRLDQAKGVDRIIGALQKMEDSSKVGTIHFIGDGPRKAHYQEVCKSLNVDVVFHGFLPRNRVAEIMAESHFLLLPSDSEGFPKVIAEAANYGCIPVSSDVSCIADYVLDGHNGFLFPKGKLTDDVVMQKLTDVISLYNLKDVAKKAYEMAAPFTFESYAKRIINEIA